MTTLRIPSGNEWRAAAPPSFLTSEVRVLQVTSRAGAPASAEPASSAPCLIFPFQTTTPELTSSHVDDFAVLAAEVENEDEVRAGRRWVAETFYPGDLTLAALRLSAGISQSELGSRCGLEQSHISRYESGKHEPGIQVSRALADALGVDLGRFADAWAGSRQRLAANKAE